MSQEPEVVPEKISLSRGCILCHEGAKMVLFVTGKCHRTCWYCPLSRERKDHDVVFANDRKVMSPSDIIKEARAMSALGTGVTGGEPLLVLDRTIELCSLLKDEFGPDHHIHLYTGLAPNKAMLESLQGLVDEIRLHPPHELWPEFLETNYATSAILARQMRFAIGIEVPSLPGIGDLASALPLIDFLNVNELEWGESCADAMRERGLEPEDGLHNAVKGACDLVKELPSDPKIHLCLSVFKDSVQLRERLRRIAANTARSFEEVTDDGTVVYGVLEPVGPLNGFLDDLCEDDYETYDDGRVEIAWWALLDRADLVVGKKYVVERYPNGGMVVEVTPIDATFLD